MCLVRRSRVEPAQLARALRRTRRPLRRGRATSRPAAGRDGIPDAERRRRVGRPRRCPGEDGADGDPDRRPATSTSPSVCREHSRGWGHPRKRPKRVTALHTCTVAESEFEASDGVAFAVRLINTWDELGARSGMPGDVGFVRRFLDRHALTDAARVAREDDIEWLRDLRGRLTRAWDAVDEETAVVELEHDPGRCEGTAVAGPAQRPIGVPLRPARAADPQFGDACSPRAPCLRRSPLDAGRLGRCVAAPCRCVFVDRRAPACAPLLLPALRRPRGPPGVQAASPLLTFALVISS